MEQKTIASADQALSNSISKMRAKISEAYGDMAALGNWKAKRKGKLQKLIDNKMHELKGIEERLSLRLAFVPASLSGIRLESLQAELEKLDKEFTRSKAEILRKRSLSSSFWLLLVGDQNPLTLTSRTH